MRYGLGTYYVYVNISTPETPWVIRLPDTSVIKVASWESVIGCEGHTEKTLPADVGKWTVEIRDANLTVEAGKARFS